MAAISAIGRFVMASQTFSGRSSERLLVNMARTLALDRRICWQSCQRRASCLSRLVCRQRHCQPYFGGSSDVPPVYDVSGQCAVSGDTVRLDGCTSSTACRSWKEVYAKTRPQLLLNCFVENAGRPHPGPPRIAPTSSSTLPPKPRFVRHLGAICGRSTGTARVRRCLQAPQAHM
jgi:hypothetical protein